VEQRHRDEYSLIERYTMDINDSTIQVVDEDEARIKRDGNR
jgi:hypothetical protein